MSHAQHSIRGRVFKWNWNPILFLPQYGKTNKEHHLGIKREIPFYGADKGNWGLWWSFSECILCERIVSPAIHKAWADAFICGAFFVHSNCQNIMQKLLESKLSKCKVCRSQWSISKETSDKGPVVGWISLWQYHLCRQLGHFFVKIQCRMPPYLELLFVHF